MRIGPWPGPDQPFGPMPNGPNACSTSSSLIPTRSGGSVGGIHHSSKPISTRTTTTSTTPMAILFRLRMVRFRPGRDTPGVAFRARGRKARGGYGNPGSGLMPEQELLQVDQGPLHVLPRLAFVGRLFQVAVEEFLFLVRRWPGNRRQCQLEQDFVVALLGGEQAADAVG